MIRFYPNKTSRMGYLGLMVPAGSLDEGQGSRGSAHYLEHMVFKGSLRFPDGAMVAAVESAGGEVNAYTSYDHTYYYCSFLADAFDQVAEAFLDTVLRAAWDLEAFETERQVILEEIARSTDDVNLQVTRCIYSRLYAGSEAHRPVIGGLEQVATLTPGSVRRFYEAHYNPHSMVLSLVGPDQDMEHRLNALASQYGLGQSSPVLRVPLDPQHGGQDWITRPNLNSAVLGYGLPSPPFWHEDAAYVDLAAWLLGGTDLSVLHRHLYEDLALVDGVSCLSLSHSFGGATLLRLVCEPSQLERAHQETLLAVERCLADCWSLGDLDRAKTQFTMEQALGLEEPETLAKWDSLGSLKQGWSYQGYLAQLLDSNAEDVRQALRRWWHSDRLAFVALVPEDVEETRLAVPGWKFPRTPEFLNSPKHRVSKASPLIYRQVLAQLGGVSHEPTPGAGMVLSQMLGRESISRTAEQVGLSLENGAAHLSFFSGQDASGYEFYCFERDRSELLSLVGELYENSSLPASRFERVKGELIRETLSQNQHPAVLCMNETLAALFSHHPYALRAEDRVRHLESLCSDDLLNAYEALRRQPGYRHNGSELSPLAEEMEFPIPQEPSYAMGWRGFIERPSEQIHVVLAWPGHTWTDPLRVHGMLIVAALSQSQGPLNQKLREDLGLVYTVTPFLNCHRYGGSFGLYFATTPAKAQQALDQVAAILNQPLQEKVIERARVGILASCEREKEDPLQRMLSETLMRLYQAPSSGELSARLASVATDQVNELFQQRWSMETCNLGVVGPNPIVS